VLGDRFTIAPGGKAANQAAQLARLGVRSWLISAVGQDALGDQISDELRASSVDITYVGRLSDRATGASVVIAVGGEYASVIVPGAAGAQTEGTVRLALPAIAQSMFVVAQLELGAALAESTLRVAKEHRATTVLNVSPIDGIDPANMNRAISMADVVVVNRHEASMLAGCPVEDMEQALAAASFIAQLDGPSVVVVTCGAEGVVLVRDREVATQDAFAVAVADTVGAGDAFLGGLLAGWCEGRNDREALRLGAAAGALCASGHGAFRSLPNRQQVCAFLDSMD
jgi:ribokinase